MTDFAIKVEGLGKRYSLRHQAGRKEGFRHLLEEAVLAPWKVFRKKQAPIAGAGPDLSHREDFWALQDVSFEIKPGEVVGIIGRNGAGKSTLLKILSRITEPTRGRVSINGRAAALLEVGTGFHPELTGRENIYLNGTILGMSRKEIKGKFDEIIAFAEIEKFLDTPVKHYSSGMYVRLAFAVAAHLEPEILVVDEVLAVGDAQFQKKCLGKMQDVSKREGRTVLFVSHNMGAVLQLTSRAIVLNKGQIVFQGDTGQAVDVYTGCSGGDNVTFYDLEGPRKVMGTQAARILSLRFNRPTPIFTFDEDFRYHVRLRAQEDLPTFRTSMTLFNAEGIALGGCFSPERGPLRKGEEIEVEVILPQPRLSPGHYYCAVAVGKGSHKSTPVEFDIVVDTLFFEVLPDEGSDGTLSIWPRQWGPIIFPDLIHAEP